MTAAAAEARLAEAVGLAASIGLVVVHYRHPAAARAPPADLLGEGQVEHGAERSEGAGGEPSWSWMRR